MKTSLKKQIIEQTGNNYEVLLEATERLTHTWQYIVIWNHNTGTYMAAWNNCRKLNYNDFKSYDTYKEAKAYIVDAIY